MFYSNYYSKAEAHFNYYTIFYSAENTLTLQMLCVDSGQFRSIQKTLTAKNTEYIRDNSDSKTEYCQTLLHKFDIFSKMLLLRQDVRNCLPIFL